MKTAVRLKRVSNALDRYAYSEAVIQPEQLQNAATTALGWGRTDYPVSSERFGNTTFVEACPVLEMLGKCFYLSYLGSPTTSHFLFVFIFCRCWRVGGPAQQSNRCYEACVNEVSLVSY